MSWIRGKTLFSNYTVTTHTQRERDTVYCTGRRPTCSLLHRLCMYLCIAGFMHVNRNGVFMAYECVSAFSLLDQIMLSDQQISFPLIERFRELISLYNLRSVRCQTTFFFFFKRRKGDYKWRRCKGKEMVDDKKNTK